MANRASSMAMASPKVGMNGTRISRTFDGRWVKTMVFKRPILLASAPAAIDDPLWRRPTKKKTRPITSVDAPNLRWNQKTRKEFTTNPPPKESTANNPASPATFFLERISG